MLLLCQHFMASASIVWVGMEITAAVDSKPAGSILTQDNAEIQQGSGVNAVRFCHLIYATTHTL